MKRVQQGFTLIELMIVVAIVGILAAIALPAYQDYVVRSKMSEAEAAIAACKTSISEYTSTHAGTLPAGITESGCSQTKTKFMSGLSVTNGVIVATAPSATTGADKDCLMTLTPTQDATDKATITSWVGSGTGCLSKYLPSAFR